jgi:hypothetical protein
MMSKIYVVSKKTKNLTDIERDSIVNLHQTFFALEAEDIMTYLKNR